ncbi:ferredoxin--NADP reductase [Alphaproteobacteria bacterium]|nr:ferredoxin--NADP reductase [Alphaproteobacteria bacterium]GHS95776.1 ferredoxin--NADP reductase [Alphaproteobacteria bacterium]
MGAQQFEKEGPPSFDVAILGAGPSGLFATSLCRMLGLSVGIFDALPLPGGQCAELYPQKPVYGVPAFQGRPAQELIDGLYQQALSYAPQFFFKAKVEAVRVKSKIFEIGTATSCAEAKGRIFSAAALILATGLGSFAPVKPNVPHFENFEAQSVRYGVQDTAEFRNKNIIIAGGGDAALDWALEMTHTAQSVTLVHRRDHFRCSEQKETDLKTQEDLGRLKVYRSSQLADLLGEAGSLQNVVLTTPAGPVRLPAEKLLVFFGLAPTPVLLIDTLEMKNQKIVIQRDTCATNLPGVLAIGDAVTYANRANLIISGLGEAATAAYSVLNFLRPDAKTPGLSPSLSTFKGS